MRDIVSVDQFKALKADAKSRCSSLTSNCFLTSGGLESIMEKQGLLFEEFPQGLVLYTDEGPYYRVFYYLDEAQPLPNMAQDKQVVIEEPDAGNRRAEYLERFFEKLEQSGWERVARNIQVYSSLQDRAEQLSDDFRCAVDNLAEQGLQIVDCPAHHVDRVIELWQGNLHVTDLPKEHLGFIDDPTQRVVCVVNDSDYVCGVNWWRMQGGNCEIRHTVTDSAYYKRGIGYTLQLAAMKDAVDHGCRGIFTYIDERNYRSINMFKKAGIVENGRTTVQYALTRGEQ